MKLLYVGISLFLVCFTGMANQPNIVFLFSDDHATQAIGAYGHELAALAPTPYLDRIAEQGMRFDRCLVGNSICGPSRATISQVRIVISINSSRMNIQSLMDHNPLSRRFCNEMDIRPL